MEDLTFGEQVKIILGRKGMSIKQLAEMIEKKTRKKMSRQNLTQRLGRDNFQEQDMRMIAEILGCPFHLSIMGSDTHTQSRSTAALERAAAERTEKVEALAEQQALSKEEPVQSAEEAVKAAQETVQPLVEKSAQSAGEAVQETVQSPSGKPSQSADEPGPDERDMTIGELYDMHKDLSVLEENVKAGKVDGLSKAAEAIGPAEAGKAAEAGKEADSPQQEEKDFEPVIGYDDVEEDTQVGEVNPYTGREYQSNSVRMHPTRIGYVQVYDRTIHKWTDMTEWAFLGLQERKKALLGKAYEPPIYLD